jgi:vacuolar protein sorting-associated protein 13A/C
MSLTTMGKDAETVRFLDDIDFTFSLDNRSTTSQQTMSIEMTSQPVVFRASYRDINLITTIMNKAIELYTESTKKQSNSGQVSSAALRSSRSTSHPATSQKIIGTTSRSQAVGKANVIASKEQVTLSRLSMPMYD